jgi:predicted porin
MKKSLLALAVLGTFASVASAQSSVTLSGGIDAAVQRQNGAWNMSTGNSGRTNFTLSGREDLGGGMYAFFSLNHRFSQNTGVTSTAGPSGIFWRQDWVGLGGGFGDVRLGRMLPVLQEYNGGFDPFGTETIGSTHTGGINAGIAGNARINNAIYYRSPSMGGLQVHANIAAADQNVLTGTTLTGGSERPIGIGAIYAAGPLRVAAAYDRNAVDQKTKGLYAAYNFGVADVMFQWEKGDVSPTADVSRWSIGARIPVGAITFKAGYLNMKDEGNQKKIAAGADYALSKRTIVYADVAKVSGDAPIVTSLAEKARFDVGIWHKF